MCNDLNECGTEKSKPETYRECDLMSEVENLTFTDDEDANVNEPNGFFSAITGAVTGALGTPQGIAGGIFVILVLGGFTIVILKRRS